MKLSPQQICSLQNFRLLEELGGRRSPSEILPAYRVTYNDATEGQDGLCPECVRSVTRGHAFLVEWHASRKQNAKLVSVVSALETLINLHDGIEDGGEGITSKDWAAARAVLKATQA